MLICNTYTVCPLVHAQLMHIYSITIHFAIMSMDVHVVHVLHVCVVVLIDFVFVLFFSLLRRKILLFFSLIAPRICLSSEMTQSSLLTCV